MTKLNAVPPGGALNEVVQIDDLSPSEFDDVHQDWLRASDALLQAQKEASNALIACRRRECDSTNLQLNYALRVRSAAEIWDSWNFLARKV